MIKETLRWLFKSFASNQAHALDGTIDGVILNFPDCVIYVRFFDSQTDSLFSKI